MKEAILKQLQAPNTHNLGDNLELIIARYPMVTTLELYDNEIRAVGIQELAHALSLNS